ncbi:MAG: GNAT family N-acetyltransferase [Nostocaceae cyanobacterium]|nr:GNAT family N-acetyltransferase [Nostocaceae cyanobacterium]
MSDYVVQTDDVIVRRMRDEMDDYELMEKWRTDERVLEFYGGRDYPYYIEDVKIEYLPLIRGYQKVVPCIFSYQNIPVGYLQYYALNDLSNKEKKEFSLEQTDGVYAIDLFIGEPSYWSQGIGTKVLVAVINYIFTQLSARKIVIDPYVGNHRAIRCYEKCGFVKVKILPKHDLHEGKFRDCWLMAIDSQKSLN